MILFVFEGKEREPKIFKTLEYLFFKKGQTIVCSFNNNIYELYRQLSEMDGAGDIVSLLREINSENHDSPFSSESKSSDFSEIFLFFDYDFQNKNLTVEQMNAQLSEMFTMFDDETDNGKLYINYPMIEAIRYTKTLPDKEYVNYVVSRSECQERRFKDIAAGFSSYSNLDYIILDFKREPNDREINKVASSWQYLKEQNVSKANFLCTGVVGVPANKDDISQKKIFQAEIDKFVLPCNSVSILCAFPIFLYDYFKVE